MDNAKIKPLQSKASTLFLGEKEKKQGMKTLEELLAEEEARKNSTAPETVVAQTETTTETQEEVVEEVKVEDVAVETQVETTQTETTETTEEKPEGLSFLDKMKELGTETPDSTTEQTQTTQTAETQTEIPDDVKAKLEELEAIKNNPIFQAIQLGANKEDIKKLALEIANADVSTKTFEQLLRMEIETETGLQGDELEDELNAQLAKHESLLVYDQKKFEKELRNKFSNQTANLSTLSALEAAMKANPKEEVQDIEVLKAQTAKQEQSAIASLGKNFVGTVLHGVEFTEQELENIIKEEYSVESFSPYVKADGSPDVSKFLFDKFRLRNFEIMTENAAKMAQKNNGTTIKTPIPNGKPPLATTVDPKKETLKELGIPDYLVKNYKLD